MPSCRSPTINMIFPKTVVLLTSKYQYHTQCSCTAALQAPNVGICIVEELFAVTLAWHLLKMVLLMEMTSKTVPFWAQRDRHTHRGNTHQSQEKLSSQKEVWLLLYLTEPCWSQKTFKHTVSMQLNIYVGQPNKTLRLWLWGGSTYASLGGLEMGFAWDHA